MKVGKKESAKFPPQVENIRGLIFGGGGGASNAEEAAAAAEKERSVRSGRPDALGIVLSAHINLNEEELSI